MKKKNNKESSKNFLLLNEIFSLEEEGMGGDGTVPINPTEPSPMPQEMQNISLDMKVDSYMMKYEKESLPTSSDYQLPTGDPLMQAQAPGGLGNPASSALMEFVLFEAGEDEADPLGGGGFGDDAEGQASPEQKGPEVPNPRFNASNFAQSVARLIMNFEGLIDPKTVLLNRAKAFVAKNYDAGVATQVMEILKTQFGLEPTSVEALKSVDAPIAAGSWTGVGGGGG